MNRPISLLISYDEWKKYYMSQFKLFRWRVSLGEAKELVRENRKTTNTKSQLYKNFSMFLTGIVQYIVSCFKRIASR